MKNGTKIDGFVIVRLIARGGMGEVYEAYEQALDRKVALKIVTPNTNKAADLVRRFMREARILAKVNHPNIVTVYSIKAGDDLQYLSMELVEGVSFKDYLAEFTLPIPLAISLFMKSLAAVQVVHRLNIIHRDLKPSNILFLKDGEIKILDFGIAQFAGNDSDKGVVVGSPPYMAPELNDGYRAGWATECWSLGAILYELVTRQMIFHRVVDKAVQLADGDRDMVPDSILKIIEKACAKDPKARYQNSDEFMNELIACAAEFDELSESEKLRLQGQVKELLNRARCMVDTQIFRPPLPGNTMIQGLTSLMPTVPEGTRVKDISASTIVQRKSVSPPPQPVQVVAPRGNYKKSFKAWYTVAPAALLVVGVGFYIAQSKNNIFSDSGSVSSAFIGSAKTSDMKSLLSKAPKPEEPAKIAKAELETKPVEVLEPLNQLLQPSTEEAVLTETKRIEFKWSENLKFRKSKIEIAGDLNFTKILFQQPVTGNNFVWKKQVRPGVYYWRLSPVSASKDSAPAAMEFFVMDSVAIQLEAPKQKQEFVQAGGDATNVDFRWACKSGVESYQVEISPSLDFSKAAKSTVDKNCTWSTPLPEGTYFWRLKSAKRIQELEFTSQVFTFKISKPVLAQSKPAAEEPGTPEITDSSLTRVLSSRGPASAGSEASLELRWRPTKAANTYQVQVSKNKDFSDLVFDKKLKGEKVSWNASAPGTSFYRVRAIASDGAEGPFSKPGQILVQLPTPKLAKAFNFTVGQAAPVVEWAPVSTAKKYIVQVGKKPDLSDGADQVVLTSNININKEPGTYFVRVAASDSQTDGVSDFSKIAKVKISAASPVKTKSLLKLMSPPKGAKAPTRNGLISIEFSWQPLPLTTKYVLELSMDPEFDVVVQRLESPENRFLVEKISQKGRLYWRVKAEREGDTGEWSEASFLELL